MTHPTILVAAAGSSSRMRGGDKLLELVDGVPMLRRQVLVALSASPVVLVTLREDRPDRALAVAGLPVTTTVIADADEGMAASIRTAALLGGGNRSSGLMILPADMPDLSEADLARLTDLHRDDPDLILRATAADGTPGHPVIFPSDLFAELAGLRGDAGARSVLARHEARVRLVALPGQHATTDLDTPEDWAAWRAARGSV